MTDERPTAAYPAAPAADLIPGLSATDGPVAGGEPSAAETAAQPYNFDLVLRGYDRHQVHQHLDRVAAAVDQLRVELAESTLREKASAAELARLRGDLERGRPSYDSLGERVGQILGLAESEADSMRADAGRDAADIRSNARLEAEDLVASARREVAELDRRRTALLAEMASMRDVLQSVLTSASEPWPSTVPDAPAETQSAEHDVDLTETQVIEVGETAAT